jgi:hypothetical protein
MGGRHGLTPKLAGALRRDTVIVQPGAPPRRVEYRLAPPKYTERRRSRPGGGRKRARAVMAPRRARG